MKFEYETKKDDSECVAYIDGRGALLIKTDDGVTWFWDEETPNHGYEFDWKPYKATHKFYPGDKVTITF